MEGPMKIPKNLPHASGYAIRTNYRRQVMLKTALIILAILGAIFSLINFQRGFIFFTIVEAGLFVFCLVMLYLLRRPKLLSILSLIFCPHGLLFRLLRSSGFRELIRRFLSGLP